jgi:hypothetical protein
VRVFIAVIIFLCASLTAQAALYIDDTCTTSKGHFILEFSGDYYKDEEGSFDTQAGQYVKNVHKEKVTSTNIYYGLTDKWEIGLTLPYGFIEDSSSGKAHGFSDAIINTKYRFWQEKEAWPSYAVYVDVKLDNGNEDKNLGTGDKNFAINNIFTKTAGNNIFDLNLGYSFVEGGLDDIFYYAWDWTYNINEKICLCNEIYGETNFKGDFDENAFVYCLSLDYQIHPQVCLEWGTGVGISRASPDYQFSTTVTFNF